MSHVRASLISPASHSNKLQGHSWLRPISAPRGRGARRAQTMAQTRGRAASAVPRVVDARAAGALATATAHVTAPPTTHSHVAPTSATMLLSFLRVHLLPTRSMYSHSTPLHLRPATRNSVGPKVSILELHGRAHGRGPVYLVLERPFAMPSAVQLAAKSHLVESASHRARTAASDGSYRARPPPQKAASARSHFCTVLCESA
jgi:hypothetical protein